MTRRPDKNILTITISNSRGSFERVLAAGDKLRVGRHPDNDIAVIDSRFPKSMLLFTVQPKCCVLQINEAVSGEIRSHRSSLRLQDLVDQDILEQKNGFYQLAFSTERAGTIAVGDSRITFHYAAQTKSATNLPDYSWRKAAGRDFSKELLFKILLMLFIVFEAWFAFYMQNVELPPEEPPQSVQVQKRFARFMLNQQPTQAEQQITSTVSSSGESEGDGEEATASDEQSEPSSAEQQVQESGLLGLIGGTGASSNKSATADFLLNEGVVKELDELLGSTTLRKNNAAGRTGRTGTNGNATGTGDDLLGLGSSTDVDEILAETGGLSSVALERQGSVNIQQPQSIRGSQQARGNRTSESVMQIINAQQGRIMYTYNRYLKQNSELRGKISVDMVIAANGNVTSVTVVESTMADEDFVRDVINILRRLRFGAIQEGSVTVNLPFVFNRVG